MNWVRELARRMWMLLNRRRFDAELEEEMKLHLELCEQEQIESGQTRDDARAAAHRRFGNRTYLKEESHIAWGWAWLEHLAQDICYGLRTLRKSPGFSLIAVSTIALGIGATTAIFSVIDATLLNPLPYPHPEQLVKIEDDLPGVGAHDVGMSVPEWHDLERSGIFQYVSPMGGGGSVNLTGSSEPTRAQFNAVPPNYFALLGVEPELGGSFKPNDHTPGFNLEVLISDGLWTRAFGRDPRILGKSLRLDNDLYRLVGVMPPGFHDPGKTSGERNTEVWAGTGFAADPAPPPLRKTHFLVEAVARIKPGITIEQAQSRIDALVASVQKQFPDDYPAQNAWRVRLVPLKESLFGNVRESLMLLLGAVALVLLIGCVNIANLLLARASARAREMAVRQALGAAPRRLVRQLLTESLVVSVLGGLAGLAILYCTKGLLLQVVPQSLPRLRDISVNWSVLLFASCASIAAGLTFGLAPALHAGRLDLTHMLKLESRGSTSSGEQAQTRRVLLVTEFALSLVLMIVAGLLLRSFWDLLNVRLGFDPQNVIAAQTWLPIPNDPTTDIYRTAAQEAGLVREVVRRCKTLPGVREIAVGDEAALPLGHGRNDLNPFPLIIEGRERPSNQAPIVHGSVVTPAYFRVLDMALVRGRLFSDFDPDTAPQVAVVNEAFVRTYFPNEDPVGKRLKLPTPGNASILSSTTVIGVVADARTESLSEPAIPQLFFSMYQRRAKDLVILLRGHLDTAAIPVEVREQVQAINPELPVFGAQMLSETVAASLSERRFSMGMIGLFALTALLLAGLGIYGVISYMVSERTHEIGIRLALGAQKSNILQMILRQGLKLAIAGAAIGLVAALIVSQLMAGVLYGVRPTDPLTFAGVPLLLIAVALLACYAPARRAVRIDPMAALRYE